MIDDIVRLDGAPFRIKHLKCRQGLVHAVLRVTSDRYHAPQHANDAVVRHAEPTDEPVLTCFTCINHQFVNSPSRDIFDDVDEDGTEQDDDN